MTGNLYSSLRINTFSQPHHLFIFHRYFLCTSEYAYLRHKPTGTVTAICFVHLTKTGAAAFASAGAVILNKRHGCQGGLARRAAMPLSAARHGPPLFRPPNFHPTHTHIYICMCVKRRLSQ